MMALKHPQILRAMPCLLAVCLLGLPAYANYSGGSGTAQDPYQIATAADLIALGEMPTDYDKHFILTADIDLDLNLLGGGFFDRAVIAGFTGVLDGNGHRIPCLRIKAEHYVGLFGRIGLGQRTLLHETPKAEAQRGSSTC